ncbi:MAG: BON domain-containing protein [Sphaerobacter sp.]|nr:BON domain-containing protein [Sphaerobacter sp.]
MMTLSVRNARAMRRMRRRTRRQQQPPFRRGILVGMTAGALGMFLLDPREGRRRRALARDKVVHLGHWVEELVEERIPRRATYLAGVVQGVRHRVTSLVRRQPTPLPDDDQFITDRVMSIVFRDPTLPKGDINVNTVDGVVYLRGTVDDPRMVQEIEKRVRQVEGVRDVVNVINRPDVDPSDIRAAKARQIEEGRA